MVDFPVFPPATVEETEAPPSGRPLRLLSLKTGNDAIHVLLVGCGSELQFHLRQRLSPHWLLREAASGVAALHMLQQEKTDMLLVASSLPDLDVEEFQQLVKTKFPAIQILDLDGFVGPSEAVSTGNEDERFVPTSSSPQAAPLARLPAKAMAAAAATAVLTNWGGIRGESPLMQTVFRTAALAARSDITVLIGGESGTGKDLLARAIHNAGARARQPFVVINCAAIPEALLESELFGYTKGAFTGAVQARAGRVHAAHGGTLFLDEIGDMPLPLQSKILRFLEQGEVQRLGSTDTLKVDCRIVAATNADLQQHVKARLFREDLYYRLAVMPIAVPPLRERMSDLPVLCAGFLERFCPGTVLHSDALALLMQHRWPGNIRELRNVMERASLFSEGRHEIFAEEIVL